MTHPTDPPASPARVSPASGGGHDADAAEWPLRFFWHKFDASCYSTYGCKVKYGNYRRIDNDDELKLSSASIGDKYPKNLSAGWGPIQNFPPPALVTWRSKDGTPLHAEIDMAEIFKDQFVLHNLKREETSVKGGVSDPQIILEVNDRTINVYMRAFVSTKEAQIPGNKYSFSRNDLIKAFSRTYQRQHHQGTIMGSMNKRPDGADAGCDTEHRQPPIRGRPWAAALFTSLALIGCQNAMTNPANSSASSESASPSSEVVADWPLRFTAHWFGTSCYSAYGCNIKYGHYWREEPDGELKLSSASIGDKYPNNLGASYGPIRNFPPPAVVTWRSKDGTPLRAEIDMAEIFKDQLVLHNLVREEVSPNTSSITPGIILEVNDRTINVYMRAFVSTKEAQIPGNKYSFSRSDLIKAFSRTY
ncbi:hypothetical protein [Variovorax sp. Sphag1AA]|uniref:hypothetical protein n=1 Tax=Variovorax sp. Sphag1AA TaxID=2587027 RepID=UPI00161EFEC3|nr:hypothetical protein [Variovorax sp. Sphag1AA]MBB3179475.1 hypothetical protein [Variovorax sp. Sphag1AA]